MSTDEQAELKRLRRARPFPYSVPSARSSAAFSARSLYRVPRRDRRAARRRDTLFYTDGLIERRHEPLDVSRDKLLRRWAELDITELDSAVEALVNASADDGTAQRRCRRSMCSSWPPTAWRRCRRRPRWLPSPPVGARCTPTKLIQNPESRRVLTSLLGPCLGRRRRVRWPKVVHELACVFRVARPTCC
jgi:hypothetical protein